MSIIITSGSKWTAMCAADQTTGWCSEIQVYLNMLMNTYAAINLYVLFPGFRFQSFSFMKIKGLFESHDSDSVSHTCSPKELQLQNGNISCACCTLSQEVTSEVTFLSFSRMVWSLCWSMRFNDITSSFS